MWTIIVKVDAPEGDVQGIKEAAAMALEALGGVRVVSVTAETPEQIHFNM